MRFSDDFPCRYEFHIVDYFSYSAMPNAELASVGFSVMFAPLSVTVYDGNIRT